MVPSPRFMQMYGSALIALGVPQELVGAEPIGLDVVPGQLGPRRTLILRADAVLPVVAGGEVAARPAQDRHAQPFTASMTSLR